MGPGLTPASWGTADGAACLGTTLMLRLHLFSRKQLISLASALRSCICRYASVGGLSAALPGQALHPRAALMPGSATGLGVVW